MARTSLCKQRGGGGRLGYMRGVNDRQASTLQGWGSMTTAITGKFVCMGNKYS